MDEPMTRKERIARERAAQRAQSSATSNPGTEPGSESRAPGGETGSPDGAGPGTRPAVSGPTGGAGPGAHPASSAPGSAAEPPPAALGPSAPSTASPATGERPIIRHAYSEPVRRLGDQTQGQATGPGVGPITAGLPTQAIGAQSAAAQHPGTDYPSAQRPGTEQPGKQYPDAQYPSEQHPVTPSADGSVSAAAEGRRGQGPTYEPLGPVRATVRTFGELCITLGLVLILFVGWQLWWTDIAANQDNRDLTTQLTDQWGKGEAQAQGDPSHPNVGKAPAKNTAFGIVYVPRFGDRYYRTVAEGVDMEPVLNRMGLGHYPGSPMPGGKGNFAVAGHRVTYGKPLNQIAELRPGDAIVVQTKQGFYTYTFRNFDVVTPDQVDVLDPVPGFPKYEGRDRIMTMTACNPMFSARERYVAYATLTDFRSAAEGAPDAIKGSPAYKKVGGN